MNVEEMACKRVLRNLPWHREGWRFDVFGSERSEQEATAAEYWSSDFDMQVELSPRKKGDFSQLRREKVIDCELRDILRSRGMKNYIYTLKSGAVNKYGPDNSGTHASAGTQKEV